MAGSKQPDKKIPAVDCSGLKINLDEDPRNRDWLRDMRKKRLAAESLSGSTAGQMRTWFIRHTEKLDIDAESRKRLWQSHSIAIHFPDAREGGYGPADNPSLEPEDYPPDKRKAIRSIGTLAREGGYVCAVYHGEPGCLVGYIPPGSEVQRPEGYRWGSRVSSDFAGKRVAVLKCLPLSRWKHIPKISAVRILAGRPRQGTISPWKLIKDRIQRVVDQLPPAESFDALLESEQVILCSEYLRIAGPPLPQLAILALSPGGTLEALDIVGISKAKTPLVAQVTYKQWGDSECQAKFQVLKQHVDLGAERVFFCRPDERDAKKGIHMIEGVHIVPVAEVLKRMKNDDFGALLLKGDIYR